MPESLSYCDVVHVYTCTPRPATPICVPGQEYTLILGNGTCWPVNEGPGAMGNCADVNNPCIDYGDDTTSHVETSGSLPRTGGDVGPIVMWALPAIAVGLWLMFLGRRRRREDRALRPLKRAQQGWATAEQEQLDREFYFDLHDKPAPYDWQKEKK